MRRIQYVVKYISLSEEGLVPTLICPSDDGPLLPNQNLEDELYLYCLACKYKKFIGFGFYDDIHKAVVKHGKLTKKELLLEDVE
jgi:hypothetical protein